MMKKIMILCVWLAAFAAVSHAQTDTTLQKLLLINYDAYKGHTVDSLVKALPANYTEMSIVGAYRGDYGDVLAIHYPNNVRVWIKVSKFKYMNPLVNKTNRSLPMLINWKTDLFKKETLAFTMVFQGAACYVGCKEHPRFGQQ